MDLMDNLKIKEDIKGRREVGWIWEELLGMDVTQIHEILKEIMTIFLIKT